MFPFFLYMSIATAWHLTMPWLPDLWLVLQCTSAPSRLAISPHHPSRRWPRRRWRRRRGDRERRRYETEKSFPCTAQAHGGAPGKWVGKKLLNGWCVFQAVNFCCPEWSEYDLESLLFWWNEQGHQQKHLCLLLERCWWNAPHLNSIVKADGAGFRNTTVSIVIGTCRLNLNILKTIWLDGEQHFNNKINIFYYQHSCACIFCIFACASNFRFPFEMLQVQDFLLRFDLGPPEGFKDDDEIEAEDDDHYGAVASVGQPGQHEVEVTLGRVC